MRICNIDFKKSRDNRKSANCKGPLVFAREHNGTVQYDPLRTPAGIIFAHKGVKCIPFTTSQNSLFIANV